MSAAAQRGRGLSIAIAGAACGPRFFDWAGARRANPSRLHLADMPGPQRGQHPLDGPGLGTASFGPHRCHHSPPARPALGEGRRGSSQPAERPYPAPQTPQLRAVCSQLLALRLGRFWRPALALPQLAGDATKQAANSPGPRAAAAAWVAPRWPGGAEGRSDSLWGGAWRGRATARRRVLQPLKASKARGRLSAERVLARSSGTATGPAGARSSDIPLERAAL